VETHGWLSVQGNKVVDEHGKPAQLRGMSLFWSQWYSGFWNADMISWLVKDWKVSLVRCPMAIESSDGGYLEADADAEVARVETVVQAAIDHGIYAIIDWHEENAFNHTAQASAFFARMAEKYAAYPNVLFEIYNEPNDKVSWWQVKQYAEQVIPAIRAKNPKALVIVGNPSWDQKLMSPADDPVAASNVAYTLHFYAASMKQWLRDVGNQAMNSSNHIALFVTEWGTCESTGSGYMDAAESSTWIDWMESNGISWANWAIDPKNESCAALNASASSKGGWGSGDLTASGSFVRDQIRKRNAYSDAVKDTFALPGTIDASLPSAAVGTKVESDSVGSGSHLAYIDSGTSADFLIKADKAGSYAATIMAAGAKTGGTIAWSIDGKSAGTTAIAGTGAWQNWQTTKGADLTLSAGVHVLHLDFQGSGTGLFNLKEIDLAFQSPSSVDRTRLLQAVQVGAGRVQIAGGLWETAILMDAQGREIARQDLGTGAAVMELSGLHGRGILRLTGRNAVTIPVISIR
jgi:endoglucanase